MSYMDMSTLSGLSVVLVRAGFGVWLDSCRRMLCRDYEVAISFRSDRAQTRSHVNRGCDNHHVNERCSTTMLCKLNNLFRIGQCYLFYKYII